MWVTRLNWAGLLVSDGKNRVAIDPIFYVNENFFGKPKSPFLSLQSFGKVDAVFITHIHSDHFDPKAIAETYGEDLPVYVPEESLSEAEKTSLKHVIGVKRGDRQTIGSIDITASFSVDGLGDPQYSWVMESGNKRMIHCGDTLWHGYWWKMVENHGPFDRAFLPINGAVVNDPDLIPSGEPICLNPEQAISAAVVLQAKKVVPIHYQVFHHPPIYNQTPNQVERLTIAASKKGVDIEIWQPGDWFEV